MGFRRQYFSQSERLPNWISGQRWTANVWLPSWLISVSMFCLSTRIAVITTMMEKTPINTPSSVSAERSLCAASAFMAIVKLSFASASSKVGCVKFHSFLKASTGFIRAARQAGRKPEISPVSNDTSSAIITMFKDR